ncbi:hypothetical protein EON83_30505 [bacterium]|nr:MAG: hypothetical protein EON83_30505 [bacterium]
MFSLVDILRARIGQHITVTRIESRLMVFFAKGSHTLTNVGIDVIETTSPTGEKFYYPITHIIEVRG